MTIAHQPATVFIMTRQIRYTFVILLSILAINSFAAANIAPERLLGKTVYITYYETSGASKGELGTTFQNSFSKNNRCYWSILDEQTHATSHVYYEYQRINATTGILTFAHRTGPYKGLQFNLTLNFVRPNVGFFTSNQSFKNITGNSSGVFYLPQKLEG